MIDTIILRVHNLLKYETLIKRLELKNNKGYTSETAKVDDEEVRRLRVAGYRSPKQIIDILKINRTGEFLVKTQVGKQMNRSDHYAFTYFVNWTKNYIEFNFSIPKYRYGSNVLMFVEHNLDRDFVYAFNTTIEYNLKKAPSLLISFIKYFLKTEFILDNIDLRDVEVNRIDVCFNQLFFSKDDALKYLEYQKRLKKKYARDEQGVLREYSTSLMYVTNRYSAKIYHKGSEYKNNDRKEHLKINKIKQHEYFKTELFQEFSDKMLRYELTIRNSYINYLFKHSIFRKDCPLFKIDYKNYLRISNSIQRNDRISKRAGTLSEESRKIYLHQNPYERISQNDRGTLKYVSKLLDKRTFYMLEIGERTALYNKKTVDYPRDKAKFSEGIVRLCLEKLLSFIKEFQIKELPEEDKVLWLIENTKCRDGSTLPKSEMVRFFSLLQKHGSFKEAGKFSGLSRATIYRYKNRFKQIGISENAMKPIEDFTLPKSYLDLKDYHTSLLNRYPILRGIKIL